MPTETESGGRTILTGRPPATILKSPAGGVPHSQAEKGFPLSRGYTWNRAPSRSSSRAGFFSGPAGASPPGSGAPFSSTSEDSPAIRSTDSAGSEGRTTASLPPILHICLKTDSITRIPAELMKRMSAMSR